MMIIRDQKPTGWFKESPNIRTQMEEATLRELGQSMLAYGQLQDVIAQSDGTLIAGFRRVAAARLVGIENVNVRIVEE